MHDLIDLVLSTIAKVRRLVDRVTKEVERSQLIGSLLIRCDLKKEVETDLLVLKAKRLSIREDNDDDHISSSRNRQK